MGAAENWQRKFDQLDPKNTRARKALTDEYSWEKNFKHGYDLFQIHDQGTDRDRLIIDVYTTVTRSHSWQYWQSVHWEDDLSPEKIREFISRVAPMSEDELREELRKVQEAREKNWQAVRKRTETRELNKTLTPEEREQRRLESRREYVKANTEKLRVV
jgi:hypothetical protein